ncbi:hypothetical protein [Neoroseomonas soli]|nr:hypothetical protein [Neoroseomonas soli]
MLGFIVLAAGVVILALLAPPLCPAEEERLRLSRDPGFMAGPV